MQTSILNFISRRPKLVESLASNAEPSSDGQKEDYCPTSSEVGAATGALTMTPSAISPRRAKEKRPLDAIKKAKHPSKKEKPVKRPRKTPGLNQSTPASLPGSSSSTSTPKSVSYKPSTHPPSCLEIARLDSISSAKASCRFYNRSLQGVYESCMLPTVTAFAALHTTSSSTYSSTMEQKSQWKHTMHRPPRASLPRTSSLSLPFLAHACTVVEAVLPEEEDPDDAETTSAPMEAKKSMPFQRKEPMKGRPRSYKNRILPTKEQWVEIKRVFAAARTAYNFANKRIRDDKAPIDTISLKKDWVRSEKDDCTKGVSTRIINNAIKEVVTSYKSNETKKKKNPRFTYEVKDRSVDARSEVVHIERAHVLLKVVSVDAVRETTKKKEKAEPVVPRTKRTEQRLKRSTTKRRAECGLCFGNNLEKVGALRIQGTSKIIKKIMKAGANLHAGALIQWDKMRNALYFIWIDDVAIPADPDPTFEHKRIASLDPGSSPFQQWYSPTSGEFGELLSGTHVVLKERYSRIDKLRKRINRRLKAPQDFVTKRQRTRYTWRKRNLKRQRVTKVLRRKLAREQKRLSGYMEAAHYDAANFLLKDHDIIIAPVLQTGWLMQKRKRKTGAKLSRNLYTWAHRLFRQRLAYTAARHPGRFVFECAEPGTSKTCTNCGAWKDGLRLGDKIYSCSHCGISVDRQIAGARNNFFAAYGMAVGLGWDGVGG